VVAGLLRVSSCSTGLGGAKCNGRHADLVNKIEDPRIDVPTTKRVVSELGAVGRNLNQLARAANQGERVAGPARDDLRALLRVCEGLRDHIKALVVANIRSWEKGFGEPV
jgi:hypothetical protein